jgi:CubicO group peptidase (beta-lactamase class C family)
LTDHRIGLDERVAKYVSSWERDPWKSKITIRQLASHSSGIDDVNFTKVQSGWKDVYLHNPDERFRLALDTAPILFEPGTRHAYSGVGYYVLAYVLGTALKDSADHPDLKSYLRDRIMKPLGIPSNAWGLSYGASYQVDGMTLYAIGSGADYTARAVARVGELFVRNGEWNGRQLIDSAWVRRALSYANSPPSPAAGATEPQVGLGWFVNSNGFFSSLPEDAAFTVGNGNQILLVVPSQRLVAVQFGVSLGEPGDDFWQTVEQQIFKPLMASIVPGS